MIQRIETKSGPRWRVRVGKGSMRTFEKRSDADDYEAKQRRQRRLERAGMDIDAGPITFDALCELYLAGYASKSKPWTEKMLLYSREKFGSVYVRTLRGEEVGRWLHGLDLSPNTKTHILGRMRAVLNAGIEWGYLTRSPIRRGAVQNPGRRRLTAIQPFESWAEVLKVADATRFYSPLVRFICATGLSLGEAFSMKWSFIDFGEETAFVPGTKTESRERTIILSKPAIQALHDMPRGIARADGIIFKNKVGKLLDYSNFGKDWHAALKLAGVAPRPPYQMRHTFATLALAQGVPIEYVSRHLGHSNIQTTLRHYAKFIVRYEQGIRAKLNEIEQGEAHGVLDHRP